MKSVGGQLRILHRFTKLEHSLFSLPLLLAGAWLGAQGHWPPLPVLLYIALAGIGARTFGMALNRIFDRDLDARNQRTAARELPSGRMSVSSAAAVAGAGLTIYLAACFALGPICVKLALLPLLPLLLYSHLKRFTCLCHFGIGTCLALAPLAAFVAVTQSLAVTPAIILLTIFTFFWISAFDIIYALQDIESDRQTGVHSLPARLGQSRALAIAAVAHLVAAAALLWLWLLGGATLGTSLALAVALLSLAIAYWPRLSLQTRFFPLSALSGLAAAAVPLLGSGT